MLKLNEQIAPIEHGKEIPMTRRSQHSAGVAPNNYKRNWDQSHSACSISRGRIGMGLHHGDEAQHNNHINPMTNIKPWRIKWNDRDGGPSLWQFKCIVCVKGIFICGPGSSDSRMGGMHIRKRLHPWTISNCIALRIGISASNLLNSNFKLSGLRKRSKLAYCIEFKDLQIKRLIRWVSYHFALKKK